MSWEKYLKIYQIEPSATLCYFNMGAPSLGVSSSFARHTEIITSLSEKYSSVPRAGARVIESESIEVRCSTNMV